MDQQGMKLLWSSGRGSSLKIESLHTLCQLTGHQQRGAGPQSHPSLSSYPPALVPQFLRFIQFGSLTCKDTNNWSSIPSEGRARLLVAQAHDQRQ